MPLTKKQKSVLDIINLIYIKTEVLPTLEDIGEKMGIGRSTAHKHVNNLINSGYLLKNNNGKGAYQLKPSKGHFKDKQFLIASLKAEKQKVNELKLIIREMKKSIQKAYGI